MEFPGFDVRRPFAAQTIHGVGDHRQHGSQLPSSVLSVDPQTGDVAKFDYGDGVIVEEPLLIPGPEGGYLLHSFLDYANQRSGVAVLRATRLEDGPIATADMDRILPIGFHGCFRAV